MYIMICIIGRVYLHHDMYYGAGIPILQDVLLCGYTYIMICIMGRVYLYYKMYYSAGISIS